MKKAHRRHEQDQAHLWGIGVTGWCGQVKTLKVGLSTDHRLCELGRTVRKGGDVQARGVHSGTGVDVLTDVANSAVVVAA
eukprot:1180879-Prorocentrum_minimum.AAC.4